MGNAKSTANERRNAWQNMPRAPRGSRLTSTRRKRATPRSCARSRRRRTRRSSMGAMEQRQQKQKEEEKEGKMIAARRRQPLYNQGALFSALFRSALFQFSLDHVSVVWKEKKK